MSLGTAVIDVRTMKDDNLFSETSMSFGEHLEELRKCLFRSLYWIVFGTLFGFFVGTTVVDFIQVPVKKSLEHYNEQRGAKKMQDEAERLSEMGYSQEIVGAIKRYRLVPEERYVFPGELERILNNARKKSTGNSGLSLQDVDNLSQRKQQRRKMREELAGMSYDSVQLDEEPLPILLFTKTADVAKTTALGVHEAFAIWVKASLAVGILLASPFVAYNLWSFVAAGLYPHEKKYVYYFIPISILLFLGGALFAFFVVFQFVLDFLFSFNSMMNIDPDPRISEWMGFALMLPIGFGASFQLPLVMFVLERVGIFTVKQYLASWRISVLVIFIIAMLLTPGDPGSMLLMAIPLTGLYFGGVFCCWAFPRKKGLLDFDEEDLVDT